MQNAARLPRVEGAVVGEVREVGAGDRGVAGGELGPCGKARQGRRRIGPVDALVTGFRPGVERVGEVGERIAERGQLPVEHCLDVARRREQRVVRSEVAVHDPRRTLFGDRRRQQVVELVHAWVVEAGELDRCRPRPVPRPQLTGDVAVVSTEVAEPDLLRRDRVQRGEHVDEHLTGVPASGLVEPLRTDAPVYSALPSALPIT